MRIERLSLPAFGPFTGFDLDFGPEPALHLIYGPNEAGKSSMLRAVRQLLFGIDERTVDDHTHKYQRLRLGATLVADDGTTLTFLRRKTRKDPLFDPETGVPVDQARLDAMLGPIDQRRFESVFGIDQEILRRGGQEILLGQGEVGHLLFGAGAGLSNLSQIRKQLRDELDALFKPRGQKPQINRLLAQLDDGRRALRDAQLPDERYLEAVRRLDASRGRRTEIVGQLRDLARRAERLKRLRDALPLIARRARLIRERDADADGPDLNDDFGDLWRSIRDALHQAQAQIKSIEEDLQRTRQEIDDLDATIDRRILENQADITQIAEEIGDHKRIRKDRSTLDGKLRESSHAIRRTLRELGREPRVEGAEEHLITASQRRVVQDLSEERNALRTELEQIDRRRDRLEAEIARLHRELEDLGDIPETSTLERTLEQIEAQGDLESQRDDLQGRVDVTRVEAEAELARLPHAEGTLEDFARLRIPLVERVEEFINAFERTEAALDHAQGVHDQRLDERAANRQRIEILRGGGDVPSLEDLGRVRRQRDDHWAAIHREWLGDDVAPPPSQSDRREHGEPPTDRPVEVGHDLATAFDRILLEADRIADQLRTEADRIAELEQLERRDAESAETIAEAETALQRARADRERVDREWVEAWTAANIVPDAPRIMKTWLQRHAKILERYGSAEQDKREADRLAIRIERARRTLDHAINQVSDCEEKSRVDGRVEVSRDVRPLISLRDEAKRLVASTRDRRQVRARLVEAYRRAERDCEEIARELGRLDRAEADCQRRWVEVAEQLQLPESATGEEARVVTEKLVELDKQLSERRSLQGRFDALTASLAQFGARAETMAEQLAADLDGAEPLTIVDMLRDRLATMQTRAERRTRCVEECQRLEDRLRSARRESQQANDALADVCREAGCAEVDRLPEAERRAAQRRQRLRDLRQLHDDLEALSAGRGVDALITEACAIDPDDLPEQIHQIESQAELGQVDLERLNEQIGAWDRDLQQMDGRGEAAEQAEMLDQTETRLADEVARYGRLQLVDALLRRGVERYRQRIQGPLLESAGRTFATLTSGSFQDLRCEIDDRDQPVLTGLRPDGKTVGVEGMSDGTRDQLYLALRLASLQAYLDQHESVPLVVDDILIHFDDERSLAALQALRDLGRRTQVLFLTHHRHLVDLARDHLGDVGVRYHRLTRTAPSTPSVRQGLKNGAMVTE